MKRSTIGWIVAAVLAIAGSAFAYVFWFAGGSGEPSTELTTPELTATTTTVDEGETDEPEPTETTSGSGAATATYVINSSQSTARFEIDEVLNGSPTHVVGATDQVAGQVRVDPADLSSAEFSEIVINARTLTTDRSSRDRAMRGPVILNSGSDEHEFITFTVTSVDRLEGEATAGSTVDFTITGDLTVKGTTQPVTFDASVTFVDASTIEGTATAEITRDMFDIGIPNVPSVAEVTNEVLIGLEFTALAG